MDRRQVLAGGIAAGVALATGAQAAAPAVLATSDFTPLITDIDKAEGVAAARDGRLFFSTAKAAIGIRETNGTLRYIGQPLAPTGVVLDLQERAIVANVGLLNNGPGPLQRIDPASGTVETLVDELEGRKLVASNGPVVARDGTIYCTHSKWEAVANIGAVAATGFVYRVTPDGRADIVARGLRSANGCCLDRAEQYLYVSLTAEGRIVRFRRHRDGALGPREDFGPVLGEVIADHMIGDIVKAPAPERGRFGYCDGVAFDAADNLWVTLPFSNRLVAITPQGRRIDVSHDPTGKTVGIATNIAWTGADLKTLLVVSRGRGAIMSARTAVAGAPPANFPKARQRS